MSEPQSSVPPDFTTIPDLPDESKYLHQILQPFSFFAVAKTSQILSSLSIMGQEDINSLMELKVKILQQNECQTSPDGLASEKFVRKFWVFQQKWGL
ncbi:hypothetical protein ElyMa_002966500 [Elysia marginata]|uniref:Uncharacterized protein n=1 Tax=Elysia marginata TaxID=1093978 RepID=A0AAV4IBT9_9GAST|nr:hypothetical protein ElyMa_002966500 [Elysia marginata]